MCGKHRDIAIIITKETANVGEKQFLLIKDLK